jgi:uncharacterized membrane protein YdjX (TVP38/TMEM64 family)
VHLPCHTIACSRCLGDEEIHDTVSENPYTIPKMKHRALVIMVWIVLLSAALYSYFFQAEALQRLLGKLSAAPPISVYLAYLFLGCIRGFTLVPATYLVVAGMLVLPPIPLFLLTIAGIVVSSAAVYYFAEAMRFDRMFERRYPVQVGRLRALIVRRELPIVIIWSFLPIAPTDLVCYVCGSLEVDLKKCLLGVTIGEGAICAIYIFLGGQALAWLR